MIKIKDLKEAIIKTNAELEEDKWIDRYDNYADLMLKYEENKRELGKKFREWEPLKFYLNVTNAKKNVNSLTISVRYLGQEVANIKVDDSGVYIYTDVTKTTNKNNKKNFECDIELNKSSHIKWNSLEAKKFREHFKNRDRNDLDKRNEEHRIESELLTEFLKASSKDKMLCGIQPVTFAGFRFSMPTAITASKEIKLGGKNGSSGGNIDILARTTGKKITVIELKDENKPQEDINKVLEQATAYAVFILKLLHSKSGEKWYKIFGFSGSMPKKITIRVSVAMPTKKDGACEKFETFSLPCGEDKLEYHWIYFEESDKKKKKIESSL